MSLDLTNSNMLDCSPFAENYSNITRTLSAKPISSVKPISTSLIKPIYTTQTVGKPTLNTLVATKGETISKPPALVTPVVAPAVVVTPPPAPVPAPPSGGGGGGGGEAPSERKAAETDATAAAVVAAEDKAFYLKMWFWGLLVGGVAGYLYAKNKGKDIKSFALIGAGIGGLGGLVVEKAINKGVNPNAPNTQVVTTAPTTTEEQQ